MANEFDYLELFGEDFGPTIARILNELPPEIETILLSALDMMVYDMQIFTAEINKTMITLEANGATIETIKETIERDMITGGRIFGRLKNSIKEKLINSTNQSSRFGQYEDASLKEEFMWVTVSGHRICQDCSGRGGEIKTFEEWESAGLPGSGWSVCGGYCYCVLDPAGKSPAKIDVEVPEITPR